MKAFRRVLVFLLFTAVFAVALCVSCEPFLTELITNVRSGTGQDTYFLARYGADGNLYALSARRGEFRLSALREGARPKQLRLGEGLPAAFTVTDFYVSPVGVVLLSIYEYQDGIPTHCALYAGGQKGFRPLLREVLTGDTADTRRQSMQISGFGTEDGLTCFFFREGSRYSAYTFSGEDDAGIVAADVFRLDGAMLSGLSYADGSACVAVGDTLYLAAEGSIEPLHKGGAAYAGLMQADDTIYYVDAYSGDVGVLSIADTEVHRVVAQRGFLQAWGIESADISSLAVNKAGSLLVLAGTRLLEMDASGMVSELTALLYRRPSISLWTLIAFGVGVLLLAGICWYLVCVVRKLYLPMTLRNFLLLGLIAVAGISYVLQIWVLPEYVAAARAAELHALGALTAQLMEQLPEENEEEYLLHAAEAFARQDGDKNDTRLTLYARVGQETHVVLAGSGPDLVGLLAEAPGLGAGEAVWLRQAADDVYSGATMHAGRMVYRAYVPKGDRVLAAAVDAGRIEGRISEACRRLTWMLYGTATVLLGCILLAFSRTARGVRRVTRGVDLLAHGNYDVRVVQRSGDEVEALAHAVNDMAGAVSKQIHQVNDDSSSYMRFMPQQLSTLLDVPNAQSIDRSTNTTKRLAVMVVWFRFPNHTQQAAEEFFRNINQVIESTSIIVGKNGSTVYNYSYDGFEAVFPTGAAAAISTAIEIRQEVLAFNKDREQRHAEKVELRIGLDEGDVMLGVVGDQKRMMPTAVSACLNAARTLITLGRCLEANILCTQKVADAAKGYAIRYVGKCREGGGPLRVHELYDGDPLPMRNAKGTTRRQFGEGIYALYSREFTKAKRIFMDIARLHNEDGVSRFYLGLADQYEQQAPEEIYINGE